ncbi:hypothetical protein GGU10DRAFT_7574 [Lentinula aff. detonsa]|uniref:Uncharacterized protein n=1 Tax=Lentinula aff. detonsa TaxID=2804958 RepID=A0AA38KB69_9AGAR|nr:hypothetical protein GGU10DRAFT_7574 [Lentinula aff. detonsa]
MKVPTFTLQAQEICITSAAVAPSLLSATYLSTHKVLSAKLYRCVQCDRPKACCDYHHCKSSPGISQLFYDGPTPPDGIFDDFLAIPFFTKDVSTRDFVSLVQSSPSNATAGTRAIFDSAPLLELTPTVLECHHQ